MQKWYKKVSFFLVLIVYMTSDDLSLLQIMYITGELCDFLG